MSIGGNADEKLRLLVVAGKGDALREYNSPYLWLSSRRVEYSLCRSYPTLAPRPQIWTIIFPESCLWLERENSEFISWEICGHLCLPMSPITLFKIFYIYNFLPWIFQWICWTVSKQLEVNKKRCPNPQIPSKDWLTFLFLTKNRTQKKLIIAMAT